jgi:hypothetical protein
MNDQEYQFSLQIRRLLDEDCENMEPRIVARLHDIRQQAVARHQVVAVGSLHLATGFRPVTTNLLWSSARSALAITALMLGMLGTYYWNTNQDADDYAEIDSALLADDLPVAAYADQGFHAWLDHSSSSSQ